MLQLPIKYRNHALSSHIFPLLNTKPKPLFSQILMGTGCYCTEDQELHVDPRGNRLSSHVPNTEPQPLLTLPVDDEVYASNIQLQTIDSGEPTYTLPSDLSKSEQTNQQPNDVQSERDIPQHITVNLDLEPIPTVFTQLDDALSIYYQKHDMYPRYASTNNPTQSLFIQYVLEHQCDVHNIEYELGDTIDPKDCPYIHFDYYYFPLKSDANGNDRTEKIFKVIQHCYKYGNPPNEQHQKQIININKEIGGGTIETETDGKEDGDDHGNGKNTRKKHRVSRKKYPKKVVNRDNSWLNPANVTPRKHVKHQSVMELKLKSFVTSAKLVEQDRSSKNLMINTKDMKLSRSASAGSATV
eukprot:217043_1